MDLSKLAQKPSGPNMGGGFNKVFIASADDIVSFPDRDSNNKAVISADIVFKTGTGWNLFYLTKDKMKLNEKGSDKRDNDAITSTFTAKYPGIGETIRQFISEHNSDEFYLLIYKCGAPYPILFGRKCNPAFLSAPEFDSGENVDDDSDNVLTFISKGPYLSATYKGAMTAGQTVIAADDATPDVSVGTQFITSANTAATEITDLDNPIVGSTITIHGGSNTNSSTITNGGKFSLTADMTLSLGSYITLYVRADDDYVEMSRG